jgi:hypothetical protein
MMNRRPLTVTIMSCLFIAAGGVGLVYHLGDLKETQQSLYEVVPVLLLRVTAIACGIFMLRGSNWARWVAVAWIAFHFILSFFHSRQEAIMHGLFFVLIAYFLFREEASMYFRPGGRVKDLESTPQSPGDAT